MDLKIKSETQEFHVRTCGIIKQGDKFLIMRVDNNNYYHIPGGHIEIGETSKAGVIRELKEEVGCDVKEAELFATQENFWEKEGKKCHGIEFYYIITPNVELPIRNYERIENDKGKERLLRFKWVTPQELLNVDLRPANIKELLINGVYNNGLIHIIVDNKW